MAAATGTNASQLVRPVHTSMLVAMVAMPEASRPWQSHCERFDRRRNHECEDEDDGDDECEDDDDDDGYADNVVQAASLCCEVGRLRGVQRGRVGPGSANVWAS